MVGRGKVASRSRDSSRHHVSSKQHLSHRHQAWLTLQQSLLMRLHSFKHS